MHTWQTELVKELNTVSQGRKEAGSDPSILDALIVEIESNGVTEDQLKPILESMGLRWFADKLHNKAYEEQAQSENGIVE